MNKRKQRNGAAAVEFALVVPVFLVFVFGIIEFGRLTMVQQVLVNASREGARRAVLEGATAESVRESVSDYLHAASVAVSAEHITVSPDPSTVRNNEQISVSIRVPFADVSWMSPFMYEGDLAASATMRSEKLD